MPRGDGTGPMGMGSMTGRGAGYCAGNATAGYNNPVLEKPTMNQIRGGGRGERFAWKSRIYATQTSEAHQNNTPEHRPLVDNKTEIEILRRQVVTLENAFKNINEQLIQFLKNK